MVLRTQEKTQGSERWLQIKEETRLRKEQELKSKYSAVPAHIFVDRKLAPLESVTEYLREEHGLSYHEIAVLVGRNDRTIWTCYNRVKKKREAEPKTFLQAPEDVTIPLNIFTDRTLAPLESISVHLKDVEMKSFHEIATILNRDDRTIWTCYKRATTKKAC